MSYFITIEGVEGAGKSTLLNALEKSLIDRGYKVITTKEPGGTALGSSIRSLLLNPKSLKINPVAELMLFIADRAQHISEVIKPNLKKENCIILCDRFIHSTLAYQGYGRDVDMETLNKINSLATNGIIPDLTILLDLNPEVGLSRVKKRADSSKNNIDEEWTRFEKEELLFHKKVQKGFKELSKSSLYNFLVLDAEKDFYEIKEFSLNYILKELKRKK